jgi:hypothetical protein
MDESDILAAYTDGGCLGRNPSAVGGTWCYCFVDRDGCRCEYDSGVITPAGIGLPVVTNNVSELCAAVEAMKQLPQGWSGTLYTDSLITLRRVLDPGGVGMKGVPPFLLGMLVGAKQRLGWFGAVLLGGHPNRRELYAGVRKDGLPVSIHNVFCDGECQRLAREFMAAAKL